MKRIFVFAVGVVAAMSSAHAQIPVTDGASIATSIQQQIQTIAQWQQQYQNMMAQINQMHQQYDAVTGSRGLGMILNNPAMRDYLPSDWQHVYDSVKSGGYAGLTGTGASVYSSNRVFDACAFLSDDDGKTACQARAVKGAQDKGFALDAYEAAKSRITQIDGLMSQINATTDPKAIAELQGRIGAEQANIQNEQTKLQMYSMIAEAESRVQAQALRERQAQTLSSTQGVTVAPITDW